jgi:uncharacterized YigZ family protein
MHLILLVFLSITIMISGYAFKWTLTPTRLSLMSSRLMSSSSSSSNSKDTISQFVSKTLEVSKSKFIARCYPIVSPAQAQHYLYENQKSDPKASHHCWAFSLDGVTRSSDDGEPSGTAGRPILAAIESQELDNIAVIVTRYYGGTKLGTGGLARAYGGSAKDALRECERVVRVEHRAITITISSSELISTIYTLMSKVESGTANAPGLTFAKMSEEYAADGSVTMVWSVPAMLVLEISEKLSEATKGGASIVVDGE